MKLCRRGPFVLEEKGSLKCWLWARRFVDEGLVPCELVAQKTDVVESRIPVSKSSAERFRSCNELSSLRVALQF